jgi:electron transfer flavoprotein beta subunit
MNIIVCIKRVPDTATKIKIAEDKKSINTQGVEFIINPYDEYAIEEALKLKETYGGEVIIISADPDGDESAIRKAFAMGADRGVLIKGGINFDGYPNASLLAEAIKGIKFDIIFFGKQAVDDDNCQIPSMVAQLLGLPRANVVTKLEISQNKVKAERDIEGAKEIYEFNLPAVISAQKGLNEPRYPTMKGIMTSKKKPIEVKSAPPPLQTIEIIKLEYPPERPPGRIVGKGVESVGELVRLLREEAKVL